ncbi:MAG TPA: tetratricopeptide repeat protein [Saprospiraceae bacterium]|nr:tetratricopeptide repeat protein [Saprospiraceae bacterium]HMP25441.1 tetratricopeptide repeat protein [Saprospiraceae bacterium]
MNFEENQTILDLISEYETSLEKGDSFFLDEKSYAQLIEYYENEDLIDKALEATEHAIRHHGYVIDFYIKKARLLMEDHQDAQALTVLERAGLFAPGEPGIDLLRAEAMAHMGLHDEAFALLAELKKQANSTLFCEIYVCEALIHELLEEYEQVFEALRAALLENPRHQEALERIWLCIESTKKYEESVRLHQQLLDLDPYSYLAWYNLGHAYAYLGNYDEAIEAYEYAYLINEKFEFAYRDRAELCFEIKQYRKALNCYLELLEQTESDSDLLLCIGQCYQQLEDYVTARRYYTQALQADTFNDEVLYYIGECYAEEGKWKRAERAFAKAIEIEDQREEYYAALAEAQFELGEWKKAETNFKKAIELAPDQIQFWMQYTGFLIEIDRVEEALTTLQEAENYSIGSEILYCRIACLFALGRRQEGCYWLGEALAEDYEMHRTLFEMMPALEFDPDVAAMITDYSA